MQIYILKKMTHDKYEQKLVLLIDQYLMCNSEIPIDRKTDSM